MNHCKRLCGSENPKQSKSWHVYIFKFKTHPRSIDPWDMVWLGGVFLGTTSLLMLIYFVLGFRYLLLSLDECSFGYRWRERSKLKTRHCVRCHLSQTRTTLAPTSGYNLTSPGPPRAPEEQNFENWDERVFPWYKSGTSYPWNERSPLEAEICGVRSLSRWLHFSYCALLLALLNPQDQEV